MNKIVLIQGSLNHNSKTAVLVDAAANLLKEYSINNEIIDLRYIELEFCDGRSLTDYNTDLQTAQNILKDANAVIIGMPVYGYSLSGALKNFLDIVGSGIHRKFVGILCQSGGYRSYLASADLVKYISFEFFGYSVQPIVHTTQKEFTMNTLSDDGALSLLKDMLKELLRVTNLSNLEILNT